MIVPRCSSKFLDKRGLLAGIFLSALLVWCKLKESIMQSDPTFIDGSGYMEVAGLVYARFLTYVLYFVCGLNTLILVRSRRVYTLFQRDTRAKHKGDGSWIVKSRAANIRRLEVPGSDSGRHSKKSFWELRAWYPKPFCLSLFCTFSPQVCVIIATMNAENFLQTISTGSVSLLATYFTLVAFLNMLNDREIIHSEMLNEYKASMSKTINETQDVLPRASGGIACRRPIGAAFVSTSCISRANLPTPVSIAPQQILAKDIKPRADCAQYHKHRKVFDWLRTLG